jgi:hypothetical protein
LSDYKQNLIVAQVAMKAAVELSVASETYDITAVRDLATEIYSGILTMAAPLGSIEEEFGGDITNVIRAEFPGAQVVQNTEGSAPISVPATPPHNVQTKDKGERQANAAWAKARLEACPDEFYDNRAKKADGSYKPNAPDFKHIDSGLALWL